MRERYRVLKKRPQFHRFVSVLNRTIRGVPLAVFLLLSAGATAQVPVKAPNQQSQTELDTITVEAQRESLKRQVRTFVSAIAMQRFGDSLARWEKPTTICPQVAGLPRNDGEFILTRLTRIAQSAGAPLGSAKCKANFVVIVTEKPEELLKGLEKKHPEMYTNGYYTLVRKFRSSTSAVRVWYNVELYDDFGVRLESNGSASGGAPSDIAFSSMRDLSSVIMIVDTQRVRESGVTYGQLAAYLAMVGLAELRSDPKTGAAPTILSLFSTPGKDRPTGLSSWDRAYLQALYHTSHKDKMQLVEIQSAVLNDIAP